MGIREKEEKRSGVVSKIIGTGQPEEIAVVDQREPSTKKSGQVDFSFIEERAKKKESKSKGVYVTLKPSVYEKSKAKCKRIGISLNEAIGSFLEEFTKDD